MVNAVKISDLGNTHHKFVPIHSLRLGIREILRQMRHYSNERDLAKVFDSFYFYFQTETRNNNNPI